MIFTDKKNNDKKVYYIDELLLYRDCPAAYYFSNTLEEYNKKVISSNLMYLLMQEAVDYFFKKAIGGRPPDKKIMGNLIYYLVKKSSEKMDRRSLKNKDMERILEFIKMLYLNYYENPGNVLSVGKKYRLSIGEKVVEGYLPVIRETLPLLEKEGKEVELAYFNKDKIYPATMGEMVDLKISLDYLAFKKLFPAVKANIVNHIIFLNDSHDIKRTEEILEDSKKEVASIIKAIENDIFYRNKNYCKKCNFSNQCYQFQINK